MAESTSPLFAFPSRWPQLADFMSFQSDEEKQKFIELMETRDRELEDAWPSGAVATVGNIVAQDDYTYTPVALAPTATDTIAWTFTMPAGLDPGLTYRAVFDAMLRAQVGSSFATKNVWASAFIEVSGFGTLSPDWQWTESAAVFSADIQPMMGAALTASVIVPSTGTQSGVLRLRNNGVAGFWDLAFFANLRVTVYAI